MLRHIAEHSEQAFEKYTLEDLLRLQDLSPEEQLQHLDNVLHVGISKIILLLQDLPFGFSSLPPIREVVQDYVQDIRDLRACGPSSDRELYTSCVLKIFKRHRSMLSQIAQGLQQFQDGIMETFRPTSDLETTLCADVSDSVPGLAKIEKSMDDFFTIRTTLRLLIWHCLQLNPEDHNTAVGSAMHELQPKSMTNGLMVGAVCLDTRPSLILLKAYDTVQHMCQRRHEKAPKLIVNGLPAEEFIAEDLEEPGLSTHLPYVDVHLYFIFHEVLKRAMLASMRKAGGSEEPPPVHASLITGTSLTTENERVVKISDQGEGMQRQDMRRMWSYFPSDVKAAGDFGTTSPEAAAAGLAEADPRLTGRGLGLSVSRVLVRYFGGDIDLHSIPRKGTDVYIYL